LNNQTNVCETIEEAYDKYYNNIYRLCLRELYYNEQSALDTVQDVFELLCINWNKIEKNKVYAWLRSVADKKIKQFKAKCAHVLDNFEYDFDENTEDLKTSMSMDEQVLNRILTKDIDKYWNELMSHLNDKEIELLNFIKSDYTYKEIADQIGSTEAAVAMSVVRLRRKVKEIIRNILDGMLLCLLYLLYFFLF